MIVANTRMYNVTPRVADLWRQLIEQVADCAGVSLSVIDYPAPQPLDALWARPDMGAVFMCGWPYRRRSPGPQIVAAPIPIDPKCTGPTYCTDMVVNVESPFRTIEDTFGGRIAWTDEGSQSGFNAPRQLLLRYRNDGQPLFRESVGPLVTPRVSLGSVLDGIADVAPLDSYFHTLLRRHEPETARRLRVVARTECTPVPVLVAAKDIDSELVDSLGRAFAAASRDPELQDLLEELCLHGFARIADPECYRVTEDWDRRAQAAGYLRPE